MSTNKKLHIKKDSKRNYAWRQYFSLRQILFHERLSRYEFAVKFQDNEDMEDEVFDILDILACKSCKEQMNNKTFALTPCGHNVCNECRATCETCPDCKKQLRFNTKKDDESDDESDE